jgi:hypothetical protein
MIFWKVLSTWPHAANLDDLVASIPFPASQVEAVEIEIFLSSQGSRIVNMKKSSTLYSFLVRAHNLKSSESSKEVNPGSIEAFCHASRCYYRKRQVLHT